MTPAATTKRTKRAQVQAIPIYTSLAQVDDALRELCDINSRTAAATAKHDLKVTELRERLDDAIREDLSKKARLERDIEDYCTYYRDKIFTTKLKSKELAHGEVNFRTHPKAVVVSKKWTIAKVIAKIKDIFAEDEIKLYVKTAESLKKDALVNLEEERLATVGLEIDQPESFGYNLKTETSSEQAPRVVNL